jgi:chemotaxis signal transduction protein
MTAAPAHTSAIARLAVATVGAVTVAMPVEAVLHALPLTGALHPLPRRQGALCGVVEHAGLLVPVVDLARWVDVGARDGEPGARAERIMVLGHGQRSIGLRVDAVLGLTDVPATALARVLHDDDPEEVFHTVVKSAELDRVLSVLDVGRLIALAAAWQEPGDGGVARAMPGANVDLAAHSAEAGLAAHSAEAGLAAHSAEADLAAHSAAADGVLHALLAIGDTRIAVPASELAQVIRMPALRAIGPAGGSSYCSWRERNLAVIDSARLLGLPPQPQPPATQLLAIIERDDLALGLIVRAAVELRVLAPPGQGLGGHNEALATTVFDNDGGAVAVINTAALFARVPEASISRSEVRAAADALNPQRLNGTAYIVFQTDQHHATAIEPIEEILALHAAHVDAQEQLLPAIAWRGQSLPVVDLRPPGTPTPPSCGARLIVVRDAGACTGYVVKHVVLLIPPNTGKLYRMALAGAGLVEFITTGTGSEQVSYRTMDLAGRSATPCAAT